MPFCPTFTSFWVSGISWGPQQPRSSCPLLPHPHHTHTHMQSTKLGTQGEWVQTAFSFFSIIRLPRPVRVWESRPAPWSAHTASRPGHQAFCLPHGSAPSVYPLDTGSVCAVTGIPSRDETSFRKALCCTHLARHCLCPSLKDPILWGKSTQEAGGVDPLPKPIDLYGPCSC